MGPNEPFWRTNSSFSPPLSRRWEYESNGDGVIAIYDSSFSSSSKEDRSWVNDEEQVADHQYSPSDGSLSYLNSPDSFQNQQLMPPLVQGVNINDHVRETLTAPQTSSRFTEGTSRVPESIGSLSSRSDDSEYELTSKTYASSHRSFTSCCSFMSKPIHPFSFPEHADEGEESYSVVAPSNQWQSLSHDFMSGGTPQRETPRSNFSDASSPSEPARSRLPHKTLHICALCERLLSQKSPWGARKIISNGDMPITGVLPCSHVYHAECLDRITPKPQKHDPSCPICNNKLEDNNGYGVEQWAICRLENGMPRLRSLGEEGTSRVWSSSMLLRNRSRVKRQLSLKGKSGKERGEGSKRGSLGSSRVSLGAVGCSSLTLKRC